MTSNTTCQAIAIWVKASDIFFTALQNKEAIQPELNLFAVQMVSQPLYSARFLYWPDAFTPSFKNSAKFF